MRFVIYDDETMEAITVINIRGLAERDIERHNRRYLLGVPEPCPPFRIREEDALRSPRFIAIWFEQFVRHGQVSWMCFTRAPDLAMLLTPDWLPGQRPAVEQLQDHVGELTDMVLRALSY